MLDLQTKTYEPENPILASTIDELAVTSESEALARRAAVIRPKSGGFAPRTVAVMSMIASPTTHEPP